jgi:glutamyl-tRNA reductase
VVTLASAAAAMRKRPALPLFLVDLSLPRNVEAAAAGLQNVFLYNLDDLSKIADENRAAREAEISRCRALLSERSALLWRQIERQLAASAPGRVALADEGLGPAVSLAASGLRERGPARLPTPPP